LISRAIFLNGARVHCALSSQALQAVLLATADEVIE
jgi:hypothetical protein